MVLLFAAAAPAAAQQAHPSRLSIDSVAETDVTDDSGNHVTGVFLDTSITADLGKGLEALVRPQIQRLSGTGEWNRQIWVADLRYEHPGNIAFRVEGGYIPSPVGLANLSLRPQLNPTIAQPLELFTSIPSLEPRGPRINLLGGIYPLGTQATVSARHWDGRVALIDNSPLRLRRVFSPVNPPRFANVVVGGGVTPIVGLRIGASMTQGGWMSANESPTTTAERDARIVTLESELAFRHTSLAGEWVHDGLETSLGNRTAAGWYVQGMQTLAPRWFVAARVEQIRTTLPLLIPQDQFTRSNEETVGYRLSPDLTLRVSHRAREVFGGNTFDHTVAASIVWYKRWM